MATNERLLRKGEAWSLGPSHFIKLEHELLGPEVRVLVHEVRGALLHCPVPLGLLHAAIYEVCGQHQQQGDMPVAEPGKRGPEDSSANRREGWRGEGRRTGRIGTNNDRERVRHGNGTN